MNPFDYPERLCRDSIVVEDLKLDLASVEQRKQSRAKALSPRDRALYQAVAAWDPRRTSTVVIDQPVIEIGSRSELTTEEFDEVLSLARRFSPWKKGPWKLYGESIDAEWRSDLKWQRLAPSVSLAGRRVADVGCHNGYFIFRMASEAPRWVLGLDPVLRHAWNFSFLERAAQVPNLFFEPLGIEDLDLFPASFETLFCLGVLYHRSDPVGGLRNLYASLVPGGELYVDWQGIPGDGPEVLIPRGRYARARGVWFLPTRSAAENLLHRAGFRDIELIYAGALATEEQRSTEWADLDSLADFLDPDDPSLTVEGYPAPWRYYFRATRP